MAVNKTKGTEAQKIPPSREITPQEKARPSSHVAAPDEFVRKSSGQSGDFQARFKSGVKYLHRLYQADSPEGDPVRGWETEFRGVVGDILAQSGLDFENIVDFACGQYRKFLKENPKEKERLKKQIARMAKKSKRDGNTTSW